MTVDSSTPLQTRYLSKSGEYEADLNVELLVRRVRLLAVAKSINLEAVWTKTLLPPLMILYWFRR